MVDATLFTGQPPNSDPAARPEAIIRGDRWRISILTDSLVRFEWSDAGVFVDERTQSVVNRDFGEPAAYTVRRDADGWLDIETERLRIVYDGGPFTAEGLAVSVKDSLSQHNTWRYGDAQNANLGGTVRTLDQIDGPTELEPGLLSGDGWMILDDSDDNLVVEASEVNGSPNPFGSWVARKPVSSTDLYFFGYARRIHDALHDYYQLTGPVPLLPRWALGNWWSRYHRYSETEYRTLIERFETEGIPFTVAVLDMDWHVTDPDPCYGSGWTGSPGTAPCSPTRNVFWDGCMSGVSKPRLTCIRETAYVRSRTATIAWLGQWALIPSPAARLSSMRPRRCSCPLTSIKSSTRWNLRALISGGSTGNKAA